MIEETNIEMPEAGIDPPNRRLYDRLYKDGLYSKSYEEFKKQFSKGESIDRLYKRLREDGKYTKPVDSFYSNFFPTIKTIAPKKTEITKPEIKSTPAFEIPKPDFTKPVSEKKVTESVSPVTGTQIASQLVEQKAPTENLSSKVERQAKKAQSTIIKELGESDFSIEKMIRQQRFELAGRAKSEELGQQMATDMPVGIDVANLDPHPELKPQDLPVAKEEIEALKSDAHIDEQTARHVLSGIKKYQPEKKRKIEESIYQLDAFNSVENDPVGEARLPKILENARRIAKGELEYDEKTGMLIEPQGVVGSFLEGWKQKSKLFDDYSFLQSKSDEEIITELEKRRTTFDPDNPIPIPKHLLSEASQMIGGTPVKPLVAGAAGSAVPIPGLGIAAASAVGAAEFYKLGYAASFQQVYGQLRADGIEPVDALQRAREQAKKDAAIDAATGGIMSAVGARMGVRPLNFSQGFRSAAFDFLKKAGGEGAVMGALGGGTQYLKNELARAAGIERETDEGVLEQIEGNFLLTVGMAAAAKLGKGLSSKNYRTVLNGLKGVDDKVIEGTISSELEAGRITEKQATNIREEIKGYKELDAEIPDNITEEARIEIQDKIKKRNELEGQKEKLNKAFHPEIKEKIDKLDEEIQELSKQKEKKEPKPKEQKQAEEIINTAIEEGQLSDIFAEMATENPEGFLKMVADQAFGRTEKGDISSIPDAEYSARQQFGDELVDKAKKMFPLEEKKSSISVILPEEQKQTETITIKPKSDAVQVESTDAVDVQPKAADGKRVGEGDAQSEIIAGEKEKSNVTGEEKVGEPEKTGITHAQMDETAREFGLDTYEQSPEKIAEWDEQAAKILREDPQALDKLFTKLRNGEGVDKVETRMMIQYMADLKAKIRANPSDALLTQLKRTKDLFNISGREKGKELVARKGAISTEESVADFLIRDMEANKDAPLTEKQKETSIKEFEEIDAAKKAYEEKVAKLEAENAKLKAEAAIKKAKAESKKSEKKDYKSERQQIFADIKEKLRKARGETSVTVVPYAKELIAIAPDVAKLVKNLVEEGIDKLPDIVKSVHTQLKELIPDITEKDVHNLIAGEYNEKKAKRSDVAEEVFNLKLEAQLINKLEALEAGVQPKNERQRIKRNQQIEELRTKIKELTKHEITDAQKLKALKTRTKNEIAKLEDQLKKGDFEPEEKETLKLDEEAKDLRDKLLKLREGRDIRLMQQEYENKPAIEKAYREVDQWLNISRQIKSTGDVSMPFRQGLVGLARELLTIPVEFKNGELRFTNFKAQRQLLTQFADMYKSLAQEKVYRSIMADIKESPRFELAQEAGLKLADPNSPLAEAREEFMYPSKLEKIPVAKNIVRASNRAATVFVNKMKWDVFNQFADIFENQGKTFANSPDAYKEAAIYANQIVGRGFLGQKVEMASFLTSRAFFSLRLQASRFQLLTKLLNPQFYTKTPKEVRIAYIKDMIKTLALGYTVIAASKAAGLSVEIDPRSSEFGKIKVGNTTIDVWGGFQQYVVLFSRLISSQTKSPKTGKITELGHEKFGQKGRDDVLLRFLRTKASPELGTAINLFSGQTFDYKPATVGGEALDFISPLLWNDVIEAYQDGGSQRALLTALLASHGVGVMTYEKEEEKQSKSKGKSTKGTSSKQSKGGTK